MAELQIFSLASGEGYGAVIHGNFVTICTSYRGFDASVAAFQSDHNYQYQHFDTAADAVAWAAATAATHQGQTSQISNFDYWEVHNGYSITTKLTDSDGYEAETFPMWIDSDHHGVMINSKTFSTRDEAIEWARQSADEQSQGDAAYKQKLRLIKNSLEAHSG